MENKTKKLALNQETLRNLTNRDSRGPYITTTCTQTGTCPTNCACPPPRL